VIRSSALLLIGTALLAGCAEGKPTSPGGAKPKPKDFTPLATAAKSETKAEEAKQQSNPNNPIILIETTMGPIKAELFEDKAPVTVKNIMGYVEDKFYDGTIFHRVIPTFMIQGGGFEPGMKQKEAKAPIKNESENGLENKRGTLAMARTSIPDSATCQFFINVTDNAFLDRARAQDGVGYCVFGQVLEGMQVVNKIKGVRTTRMGPHGDVPVEDVTIRSVRRVQ
jgi:peptidyl-prolyl cis-trans isomerase B (cyclophilin B)